MIFLFLISSIVFAQETPPVDGMAAPPGVAPGAEAQLSKPVENSAATPVPEVDEFEALASSKESFAALRDPFRMPSLETGEGGLIRSPLESNPLDTFKILGVITGPDKYRAMLQDPTGQTHLVSEKMKIGVRSGVVKKITSRGIWVQERIVNVVGQEELVDTVLKFDDMKGPRSEAPSSEQQGSSGT